MTVTGRFAPSPTGPLHAGSAVAALASWLDARAQAGRWLLRIEDVDTPRCSAAATEEILRQLSALQLVPDEPPTRQSARTALYTQALQRLQGDRLAYPCGCTRKAIEDALQAAGVVHTRHGERIYPGTCRTGLHGRPARSWRFFTQAQARSAQAARVESSDSLDSLDSADIAADVDGVEGTERRDGVDWIDRRLGPQHQDVAREVGDFVLQRADGCWAYQLAVVVDDADQGITHVVRGEDLADNTARQILLQRALGLPTPAYLHTPLVLASDGQKLSKQNGALALDTARPLYALQQAARQLSLPDPPGPEPSAPGGSAAGAAAISDALAWWTAAWRQRWCSLPGSALA